MKKYSVIYADPPWPQKAGRKLGKYAVVNGKQVFSDADSKSSLDLPYKTMTIDEICSIPVWNICKDDSHLYMWVTNKHLLNAAKVIEAWGFKYSTTIVWCKKPLGGGLGGNFKVTSEYLIFATKGALKSKNQITGTWFEVKRPYINGYPCHSKKPEFFADLIQHVSPGPYVELFARENTRLGWDFFGNEIENSISII